MYILNENYKIVPPMFLPEALLLGGVGVELYFLNLIHLIN